MQRIDLGKPEHPSLSSTLDNMTIESSIEDLLKSLITSEFERKQTPSKKIRKFKASINKNIDLKLIKFMIEAEKREDKELVPGEALLHPETVQKRRYRLESARKTLQSYIDKITENEINIAYISDLNFQILNDIDKLNRARNAKEISYTYLAIAQMELDKNESIPAWKALSKAQYFHGIQTGLDDPNYDDINYRASQGGKALSKKLTAIAKETATQRTLDILDKYVPEKKWQNFSIAAEATLEPLVEIIKSEKLKLPKKKESVHQHIMNTVEAHKERYIKR